MKISGKAFLKILTAAAMLAAPVKSYGSTEDIKVFGQSYQLNLTVYNNNTAFIKDIRNVSLPPGKTELKFDGVPSQLRPETVYLTGIGPGSDMINVLQQKYNYNLADKKSILDSYVGKDLKLITYDRDNNPERTVEARLLSNRSSPIYKIDGEIYLNHPGTPVLPKISSEFIGKPELSWTVKTDKNFEGQLKASYLTGGMNWRANYNLIKNGDKKSAKLVAFVALDNKSGADYKDAAVKLIAGKINTARRSGRSADMLYSAAKAPLSESLSREKLSGYHQYEIDGKINIKNNQKKQVKLFSAQNIPVSQDFVTQSNSRYYTTNYSDKGIRQDVNIYTGFNNNKKSNLGIPMPAGVIRVYEPDSSGSMQFTGEDNIGHTPSGEDIKILTGSAFDIVCRRKQSDYKKLYNNTYETEWDITLSNQREETVNVKVIEKLNRSWEIIENSHKYEKIDASAVKFEVPVEPGSTEKIKYRVRIKY